MELAVFRILSKLNSEDFLYKPLFKAMSVESLQFAQSRRIIFRLWELVGPCKAYISSLHTLRM